MRLNAYRQWPVRLGIGAILLFAVVSSRPVNSSIQRSAARVTSSSGAWREVSSPTRTRLRSVAADGAEAWAVGGLIGGTLYRLDADAWSVDYSGVEEGLWSVDVTSAGEAWAVGNSGRIVHFDGLSWRTEPSPTRETLWSVGMTDDGHGWAVGENGVILERVPEPRPVRYWLPVVDQLQR